MNNIKWTTSNSHLQSWKDGKTGFPLVDAGMRELNHTGFIHNRVRMVVATFLIYNLHLHWKHGEEYFSQKLIDIDVSQNQGNWRWVAGIESYSNDYYKAMSIASQTEKFDSNGLYIKKWIPELKDVKPKDLCNWEENHQLYDLKSLGYPEPIVNSKETRKKMIENMKHAILSR
jgi:deoxyribodipyrimidine photo-lyase